MKIKVMAPAGNSMQASARIAEYVAETFSAQLVHGKSEEDGEPCDVLFLVNTPVAYFRDTPLVVVERLIQTSGEVIWVENDYTMKRHIAQWNTEGESFVIRAWKRRRQGGRSRPHFWTTVRKRRSETSKSAYVNWNALAYAPQDLPRAEARDLLYYGAAREGRLKRLDYFFRAPAVPATVIGTNKNLGDRYPGLSRTQKIPREDFLPELARHGLGLYCEDERSSEEFHSPANRFYEMLSAGLPMVFHSASREMLGQAGFDVRPYVVGNDQRLISAMGRRDEIAAEQAALWRRDYRAELDAQVREAWSKLMSGT